MTNVCSTEHKQSHGAAPFFARLVVAIIFIAGGLGKAFDFQGAVDILWNMGIQGAQVYIVIGLLMELVGGILLILGWYTHLAVYILMIFLLPTTLIFHGFWNYVGVDAALQFSIFLKNLVIYGALLLLLSYAPGRWSLDARRCRKK